jgi:hypothetical protein
MHVFGARDHICGARGEQGAGRGVTRPVNPSSSSGAHRHVVVSGMEGPNARGYTTTIVGNAVHRGVTRQEIGKRETDKRDQRIEERGTTIRGQRSIDLSRGIHFADQVLSYQAVMDRKKVEGVFPIAGTLISVWWHPSFRSRAALLLVTWILAPIAEGFILIPGAPISDDSRAVFVPAPPLFHSVASSFPIAGGAFPIADRVLSDSSHLRSARWRVFSHGCPPSLGRNCQEFHA